MHRTLITFVLAEEIYANDSGSAFELAEAQARETDSYPVKYPAPYAEIGCGYGRLAVHVNKQASDLASEFGIDMDTCHQTEMLLMLYFQNERQETEYKRQLAAKLKPAAQWIINAHEVFNAR
jgi:hypothetical protein